MCECGARRWWFQGAGKGIAGHQACLASVLPAEPSHCPELYFFSLVRYMFYEVSEVFEVFSSEFL